MQNIPKPQKSDLNQKKGLNFIFNVYFMDLPVGYSLKVSVINRCDSAVCKGNVDFYFDFFRAQLIK